MTQALIYVAVSEGHLAAPHQAGGIVPWLGSVDPVPPTPEGPIVYVLATPPGSLPPSPWGGHLSPAHTPPHGLTTVAPASAAAAALSHGGGSPSCASTEPPMVCGDDGGGAASSSGAMWSLLTLTQLTPASGG